MCILCPVGANIRRTFPVVPSLIYHRSIAQSSGILVISNYQVSIKRSPGVITVLTRAKVLLWNNLGLYGSLPLLLYSVYTSWAACLNWVASRIVDRIGRVRMMIIGLVRRFFPRPQTVTLTNSNSPGVS